MSSPKIHIATVHWRTDRWISLQASYLKRNLRSPFLTYAHVEGVSKDACRAFSFTFKTRIGDHQAKLNYLASLICERAGKDDLLIFLDGDAFPIAPFLDRLLQKLVRSKLIAIQTRENNGDIQPHPAFCMTTAGFWKEIRGDWRKGAAWKDARGQDVTDTGGNLLEILGREKVPWHPLLRSNRVDLHPLWFGIYDGFLYHHGAGFRRPWARIDIARLLKSDQLRQENLLWLLEKSAEGGPAKRDESPLGKALEPVIARSTELSDQVYELALQDERFFEIFEGKKSIQIKALAQR